MQHVPYSQVCGHEHTSHEPPQPSLPHSLPEQSGTQVGPHVPFEQEPPPAHGYSIPVHVPPQPSGVPQARGSPTKPTSGVGTMMKQVGRHEARWPASQACPEGQLPHEPPHPSSPHAPAGQLGVQVLQAPATHVWLAVHAALQVPQLALSVPRLRHVPLQQLP